MCKNLLCHMQHSCLQLRFGTEMNALLLIQDKRLFCTKKTFVHLHLIAFGFSKAHHLVLIRVGADPVPAKIKVAEKNRSHSSQKYTGHHNITMFIDFCFDTLCIYLYQIKNVPVVFLCLLLPNEVLETTDRQYFLRSFHKVTQSDDMWSARGKLVEMVRKEKKYPPDPPSFLFLPSILLSSPTPPFLSPFDGTTLRTFSWSAIFSSLTTSRLHRLQSLDHYRPVI